MPKPSYLFLVLRWLRIKWRWLLSVLVAAMISLQPFINFLIPLAKLLPRQKHHQTVEDRNASMRELRDEIGAVSVGLFRLDRENDRLSYVFDLDQPVDVYQPELDFRRDPEQRFQLELGECVAVPGLSLRVADGRRLWTLYCPLVNRMGGLEGAISAAWDEPLTEDGYNPESGILYRAGFKIRPIDNNWEWPDEK